MDMSLTAVLWGFQHTAARRRLADTLKPLSVNGSFNTQPPEGGWVNAQDMDLNQIIVSTHSRPKAAGVARVQAGGSVQSFNTQPPEGGWLAEAEKLVNRIRVSTHSRPKAAGWLKQKSW